MKQRGFTLIELLVVISIMVVLSVMGIAGFISYSRNQVIVTATQEVASLLNVAKSRAQSQVRPDICVAAQALRGYAVQLNKVDDNEYNYHLHVLCGDKTDGTTPKDCDDIVQDNIIGDKITLPPGIVVSEQCVMFQVLSGAVTTDTGAHNATIDFKVGGVIRKTITVTAGGNIVGP